MSCRLIQNIKHNCEYNAGGIKNIYLLDIRDFISYKFLGDKLYNECFVEEINVGAMKYIELDTIETSNYTETLDNDIYRQRLSTFIRVLDSEKTSNLLLANSNKYLIIFRTNEGKTFCFGSDGGASVIFSQLTGHMGESSGYSLTIDKNSIYPLFEIDLDNTQYIDRIFNDSFNNKFN